MALTSPLNFHSHGGDAGQTSNYLGSQECARMAGVRSDGGETVRFNLGSVTMTTTGLEELRN